MLNDWLDWQSPTFTNAVISAVVIVLTLILRAIALRWVRRSEIKSPELRRRWILQIRNGCTGLAIVVLFIIWSAQLQSVLLSVTAIFLGLVVATKEVLLCLMGSVAKTGGEAFTVGDRIHMPFFELRGDVIDQTLLTTRVLEVGPGASLHQNTGRVVTLPNSAFLTYPVFNETLTHPWVLQVFTVPLKRTDDWQAAERTMLEAAREICAPYLEQARQSVARQSKKLTMNLPPVDPVVSIDLPDPDRVNLVVRVPLHAEHRGRDEQRIIRRFLAAHAPPPAAGASS